MRAFSPSVIAIAAAVLWVGAFLRIIPYDAGAPAPSTPVMSAAADPAVCSAPTMVAQLPELAEASGVTVSRQSPALLWAHNDSGQPILFGLDANGSVRAHVRIDGARLLDWESVTAAPCPQGTCLYLADIGDNDAARPNIAVHRTPEPTAGTSVVTQLESFYAKYPDRPQDAEAFFVAPDGAIFIVTKGETGPVAVYRWPPPLQAGSVAVLQRVVTLGQQVDKPYRITDAALSRDGQWVALRTNSSVAFYRTSALTGGAPSPPLRVDLSAIHEPQGEGVAFGPDGTVYLAGESGGGARGGTLARMSCKLPQ